MNGKRFIIMAIALFTALWLAGCGDSEVVVEPGTDGDSDVIVADGDKDNSDNADLENEQRLEDDTQEAADDAESGEQADGDGLAENDTEQEVEVPADGDSEGAEDEALETTENESAGESELEAEAEQESGESEPEIEIPPCDLPNMMCDEVCTDVKHDAGHCGDCLTVCDYGKVCADGNCVFDCPLLQTACESGCADLETDINHCGDCDTVCAFDNASPACVGKTCQIDSCNTDFDNCNGELTDGCETNLTNDKEHCGDCDTVCKLANANPICVDKKCVIESCDTGYQSCNGVTGDGCEINTTNDPDNCDGCDKICNLANANSGCQDSKCFVAFCSGSWDDCNNDPTDGCEVNLISDVENCKACGNVCELPNAKSACQNAKCIIESCVDGWADCNNDPTDGCEVNLNADVNNCKACGHVCPTPYNGVPSCSGGVCGVGDCNQGFFNCDGVASNGCEINGTNDIKNCNGCGLQCFVANGSAGCANSACVVMSCNAGFANCNNKVPDGCETNLSTDINNCNVCGRVCPSYANAASVCAGGNCSMGGCNGGYGNCDNNTSNGCETELNSNVNNCGTCGHVCGAGAIGGSCSGGVCSYSHCIEGYSDCNRYKNDGCEINVWTDRNNCGVCGKICPGSTRCVGGTCS